ncbi:MAG: protein TolQ [Polyangiales bacterium]
MYDVIFANLVTLQGAAGAAAHEQLNPIQLILQASLVVKLVIFILVSMAIGCWFIIGAKAVRIAQATRSSRQFLDAFWAGEEGQGWTVERLEAVYAEVRKYETSPIASVFRSGYVELARVMGSAGPHPGASTADIENVERALRRTAGNEMTALETLLPFLATTGSVAPFIGLFGTVWGIMQSFISIHGHGSASLDVVAPGIAEALIATAIGLVAAIPAVMAYNYFLRRIRVLESEIESFGYDYLNIVRRHFLRG